MKLSKDEQVYILFENDFSKIKNQINTNISNDILNELITISLEDFIDRINFEKLFEKYNFSKAGAQDGVWIKKSENRYSILYQERGVIQWENKKMQSEIIEFYGKLILSILPKNSHLNPI